MTTGDTLGSCSAQMELVERIRESKKGVLDFLACEWPNSRPRAYKPFGTYCIRITPPHKPHFSAITMSQAPTSLQGLRRQPAGLTYVIVALDDGKAETTRYRIREDIRPAEFDTNSDAYCLITEFSQSLNTLRGWTCVLWDGSPTRNDAIREIDSTVDVRETIDALWEEFPELLRVLRAPHPLSADQSALDHTAVGKAIFIPYFPSSNASGT